MKLTIRPDVHGRPFWRDAVKDVSYTPVVFLGDYLDLFEKACEQAEAETSKALSTGMILRYENRDAFFFPLALLSDNDKISRWIVEDYESYLKGEHRYL